MPEILFQFASGKAAQRVRTSLGLTVMKAAVEAGIEGIEGECGGVLTCATCHVRVASAWIEQIAPPSFDETELLEMVEDVTAGSRLSCQIVMSAALDGIIVEIPSSDQ